MSGMRFIQFHFEHAKELGNDRAELYFEYLVQCQKFCRKDEDGFFSRSVSQIEKSLGQKRTVQEACRKLLISKGWIECRLSVARSPSLSFRVKGCEDANKASRKRYESLRQKVLDVRKENIYKVQE